MPAVRSYRMVDPQVVVSRTRYDANMDWGMGMVKFVGIGMSLLELNRDGETHWNGVEMRKIHGDGDSLFYHVAV